jgi:hypothetical protein
MHRISLKGVIIGGIADILSTCVVALLVLIFIFISSPAGDIRISNAQLLFESGAFKISSVIVGGLCSVLGGYVSARIAKHDEVLNGALSSILCVGFGLYALLTGDAADRSALEIVLLPLSPALGALGGYLRSRQLVRPVMT